MACRIPGCECSERVSSPSRSLPSETHDFHVKVLSRKAQQESTLFLADAQIFIIWHLKLS